MSVKIKYKDKEYKYDHHTVMVSGEAYRSIKEQAKKERRTILSFVDIMLEQYMENNKQ